jgi:hypothetical protein
MGKNSTIIASESELFCSCGGFWLIFACYTYYQTTVCAPLPLSQFTHLQGASFLDPQSLLANRVKTFELNANPDPGSFRIN